MITRPCDLYPLGPHFYIVNWGLQGYTFFLIFALKHRLWVLVRTTSRVPTIYVLKIIVFTAVKNCRILHGRGFVMKGNTTQQHIYSNH